MPLIRIDTFTGRSPEEIQSLVDAIHRVVVATFKVPLRDRYQIVSEHSPSHMVVQDTGLGITRTSKCIVIQITTRPHDRQSKVTFYADLARELETACGLAPSDVVVSVVTNTNEDWSFGYGRAQFLTGDLAVNLGPEGR